MPSNKPYSNVTFTKRVDHDGGAHREPRASPEPRVCETCGAVWSDRRWRRANPALAAVRDHHEHFRPARPVLCPACWQERERLPGGFVRLEGRFLSEHRGDVERLLRNESDRASAKNPLSKIMGWEPAEAGGLVVATTTDRLALRLGRALERAFGGQTDITFSHENRLTRVRWRRDV